MNQYHETCNLLEHDKILWCGDLNYRINANSFEECLDMIN